MVYVGYEFFGITKTILFERLIGKSLYVLGTLNGIVFTSIHPKSNNSMPLHNHLCMGYTAYKNFSLLKFKRALLKIVQKKGSF